MKENQNKMKQICSALVYIHHELVIHGDLRGVRFSCQESENHIDHIFQVNILINNRRQACLSDFGLAIFAGRTNQNSYSARGNTELWKAPELMIPADPSEPADDRPTYASEIYSFACVCIEVCRYLLESSTVLKPWP